MNHYKCGTCGATDIQKLSMVYETGTSTISTTTTGSTIGGGFGGGGLGGGGAKTRSSTSGQQTTELARRAAPPQKKLAFSWIAIGFFAGILVAALFGFPVMILFWGLCGYLAWRGFTHNAQVYPGQKGLWDRSWLCHRCGGVFQP